LGFTYNGPNGEDCIVSKPRSRKSTNGKHGNGNGTGTGTGTKTIDLRGHRSVEGRLREALDDLFGKRQWENIQASSRTDRGVHALKNTFHVDIKMPPPKNKSDAKENHDGNAAAGPRGGNGNGGGNGDVDHESIERKLRDGINFYLSRQSHKHPPKSKQKQKQNPMMNELRILNAAKSPETMDNPYALTDAGRAQNQPPEVDWNARFSATQRTYVYRLLCYSPRQQPPTNHESKRHHGNLEDSNSNSSSNTNWNWHGIPFEWDRAWCLPQHHNHPLDLEAMKEAAEYLVGTHDFSSFRGKLCQRNSPIVAMKSVEIDHGPAYGFFGTGIGAGKQPQQQQQPQPPQLVTITVVANSFLYRQVRNMVGCLVEVGKHGGRLAPKDVRDLVAVDWKHEGGDAIGGDSRRDSDPTPRRCDDDRDPDRASAETKTNTKSKSNTNPDRPRTKSKHRPYSTAPPQGLFLVDVQHGGFWF